MQIPRKKEEQQEVADGLQVHSKQRVRDRSQREAKQGQGVQVDLRFGDEDRL